MVAVSTVAIIGAGPIGASIAHTLARRARVRNVRLIDAASSVAVGKALDIKQSGPVEGFDTRVSGDGNVLAAAGASVNQANVPNPRPPRQCVRDAGADRAGSDDGDR